MFKTAELNQNISKQSFSVQEPDLRYRLLKAQHPIKDAGIPVLILLSGVEGSDRSGVVVKRLNQWQRAYHEINFFEQQLIDDNTLIFKFWLHISNDEQLKRFEEPQQTSWEQYKITDED